MAQTRTYNLMELFTGPLIDEATCRGWIREMELIPVTIKCPECRRQLKLDEYREWGAFCCYRRADHRSQDVVQVEAVDRTFFSHTSLSPVKIVVLLYCFARGFGPALACRESSLGGRPTSAGTALEWYRRARDVLVGYADELRGAPGALGGPGSAVDVEALRVSYRKFGGGRFRPGDYVVAICERGDAAPFRIEHSPADPFETGGGATPTGAAQRRAVRLLGRHLAKGAEFYVPRLGTHYEIDGDRLRKVGVSGGGASPFGAWLGGQKEAGDAGLAQRLCEYLWRKHVKRNGLDEFHELIRAVRLMNANRVDSPEIEFVNTDGAEPPEDQGNGTVKEEPPEDVLREFNGDAEAQ